MKRHIFKLNGNKTLLPFIIATFVTIAKPAFANLPLVSVTSVKPWHYGETHIVNCQISAPYLTALTSESSAKLTYLVPKGSKVAQGQLIAEQQDFYLQQQLSRLKQSVKISKSSLTFNSKEYKRQLAIKHKLVSTTKLEQALLAKTTAEAKYNQLTNELNELEHRIKRLKFFAPSDGSIIATHTEPGDFLNQGDKLLSFLALNKKEIKCLVPVEQLNDVEQLTFHLPSNNMQSLHINRIDDVIESTSQFANVYLKADKELFSQRLGQRLKIELRMKNDNLTRLPVDGLNLANTGDFVWRVTDNGNVTKVAIKVFANQSEYFLVESVLRPGDKVVTLGRSGLKENQQVKVSSLLGTI